MNQVSRETTIVVRSCWLPSTPFPLNGIGTIRKSSSLAGVSSLTRIPPVSQESRRESESRGERGSENAITATDIQ